MSKNDAEELPPIAVLGASAGGVEVLREMVARVPEGSGLAIVVILHLPPGRESLLPSVLGAVTSLPVVEIVDGMVPEADRIHVIPAGFELRLVDRHFQVAARDEARRQHLPIDTFCQDLASVAENRAFGVVLSGTGADGTEGLRAIRAAGGTTFAQTPATAAFPAMPEHAIAADVVDRVLSPQAIVSELCRLATHPMVVSDLDALGAVPTGDDDLRGSIATILAAVRRHTRLDFSGYKGSTIRRRIARRAALRRLPGEVDYADVLRDDPAEARALARDLLINVTSFFRDPHAFQVLEQRVFPELVQRVEDGGELRVWVPGCSTGEEAYSIAIGLVDALDDAGRTDVVLKVFGSDLSDEAVTLARAGVYPESALPEIDPERVARHFERVDGRYRICKRVRNACVFVTHDLTKDPPFARLDLVSCRNVLIYFGRDLQRRALSTFHYCLKRPGYLFLGSSESVAGIGDLFQPVDKDGRIYVKSGEERRPTFPLAYGRAAEGRLSAGVSIDRPQPAREAQRQADHLLLSRYAPPGVIVDERFEIVQFRGRTGGLLEPPPGPPQRNVLRLARDGLAPHLHDALETARSKGITVRKEAVRTSDADDARTIHLEVVPLTALAHAADRYFLVIFEPATAEGLVPAPPSRAPRGSSEADAEIARLKRELSATRDYLHALVAEHQGATDELAALHEEMVAANEELQSSNEELESAKEELQSTNEELTTLNDELRQRNTQLDLVATDLENLLDTVEVAVVIVDRAMRVRRFTPMAREVSSLTPGDEGRPFDDVKLRVRADELSERIRRTVEGGESYEAEVKARDGRWYRVQVRPYRSAEGQMDGAIVSFVDVSVLRAALQASEAARDYARAVLDTVPIALVVVGQDSHIISANRTFRALFGEAAATEGAELLDVGGLPASALSLRQAVDRALAEGTPIQELLLELDPGSTRHQHLSVTGRPLTVGGGERMLLLAMDDITVRRRLVVSERNARQEAEQANRAKDLFLATLSHELRTPLSAILMSAQLLKKIEGEDPVVERAADTIVRAVRNQSRLIDDLLDISRIVSGKLMLDLQATDLATAVQAAVDVARPAAEAKGLHLSVTVEAELPPVHGDPSRLQQVVANLLDNAIKFTPLGGHVDVRLDRVGDEARLTIRDDGFGVPPEVLPYLFDRFVQADGAMTKTFGGLGLGLAIVRHIVHVHGGEVSAESPGAGRGSTFRVTLPLARNLVAKGTASPAPTSASIAGVRVLVVEDDDDTREPMAEVLRSLGAEVQAVASAADGLAAVGSFRPQAILCDLAMPIEDGYSFVRRLRARPPSEGGRTPAAAVTALASQEDRQRALEAGFQLHIAKPLQECDLAEAVARLVGGQHE